MTAPGLRPTPLLAINLSGFFSLSLMQMVALATPMWGGHLGLSVALIGLASGCRSITPAVYSIHLGALLDMVGVRRLQMVFALQCAVLPLLYPLLPLATAFIVLQVLLGLASTTVWVSAQTAIARTAAGDTRQTGWFSFFASAGTVIGPLALGFVWTWLGAKAGYGLISAWGCMLFVVSLMLPYREGVERPRLKATDFVPRVGSYVQAFASLKNPVTVFVLACTFIRLGGVSMMESFFPVLAHGFGHSAATIGVLFAIGNVTSSPSALLANRWVAICGSLRLALLLSVAVSTAVLALAPFLQSFWLLVPVMAGYGFGVGISLPPMFALLSQGVDPEQQGMIAGIRATANRLASFVLPIAIGAVAELAGVPAAFWMSGLVLLALLVPTATVLGKHV